MTTTFMSQPMIDLRPKNYHVTRVNRQFLWSKIWSILTEEKSHQLGLIFLLLLNLTLVIGQGYKSIYDGTFPDIEVLDSVEEILLRKGLVTLAMVEVYFIQAEWYFERYLIDRLVNRMIDTRRVP